MHAGTDDEAARVEFIYRGDERGRFTLPIEARPKMWARGAVVGVGATILTGAVTAGPVMWVQPGPMGTLVTALVAVTFGITAALTLGRAIGEADTVERPLKHRLRAATTEALTQRPAAHVAVESTWAAHHAPPTTESVIPPTLWSACVHPDCVSASLHRPEQLPRAGRVGRKRAPHFRPRRHVGVLRAR